MEFRNCLKLIVFTIIVVIVTILGLLVFDISRHFARPSKKLYEYDYKLGWRPKRNYVYRRKGLKDSNGNREDIYVTTNEYGFRAWGDIKSNKIKIFFIGDSFTGDPNMSDEDAYFSQVGDILDAEVFAYGGGGYGSLQEMMVLEEYVDIIKPDIFVLQFSNNDFSNNHYELENMFIVRNQKNLRPYLKDGKVIYRLSKFSLIRFLYKYSPTFRRIDCNLQQAQFKKYKGNHQPLEADEKIRKKELRKDAEMLTGLILKNMIDLLPEGTLKIAFNVKTNVKANQLLENAGFIVLPSIAKTVQDAKRSGEDVTISAKNAHWNGNGHKITGRELANQISALIE